MSDHPSCSCPQSPTGHAAAALDRRAFLRRSIAGALGLAIGAPLLGVLAGRDAIGVSALYAATDGQRIAVTPTIKSVIVLWMDGGPSQLDTFDPKPGHTNGGPTGAIDTAIRGAQVSANLPRVAEILDRTSVIRCMSTREGSHARARQLMRTGFAPNPTVQFPGLGAIVAHEIGDWSAQLPQNVSINGPGQIAGELGVRFDPFFVRNPGRPVENMAPARGINSARIDRRLELLAAREQAFRDRLGAAAPTGEGAHVEMMRGAVSLMRAESAQAFDISQEPAETRANYGDHRFGQGCLMARRLVEQGVRYVEVSHGGWDTHLDNFTRVTNLCTPLDQAMSALILDLESRGMLDSTLVLWMGEFGRTPRINANEGRDHFPGAWSVVAAGGGFRKGQVIGQTSNDGTEIVGNAITTADLFRTIMVAAGIDPDIEYHTTRGRPVKYADGGRVISALVQG
jgi:uncharacterized protein (DUF1501 family)